MKKRMLTVALVTMMVVFFLADVRLDIRPPEEPDPGAEEDLENSVTASMKSGGVLEFMGLLLRTWLRSVQEGLRVK